MLEKTGTCASCGYEKRNCMCGRPKNTSGEYTMYQNYKDFRNTPDYAMTARINRSSAEDRKIMEELLPTNNENVITFLQRSDLASSKLIEYSINHHLYGTKRVWSCHTTSRYCFICTLSQFLNILRSTLSSISDLVDLTKLYFKITQQDNPDEDPTFTIYSK